MAQAGVGVLAHPQERLLVEARRVQRERQELRGAVEVLDQGAHPPRRVLPVVAEVDLDRLLVERPLEGLRIEVARAFVEHAREQHAQARLVRRVLRRAAAHGEFERDHRNRVGFDQPERQPARA